MVQFGKQLELGAMNKIYNNIAYTTLQGATPANHFMVTKCTPTSSTECHSSINAGVTGGVFISRAKRNTIVQYFPLGPFL